MKKNKKSTTDPDFTEFAKVAGYIRVIGSSLLEQHFGPRCADYEPNCCCCKRWKSLDDLIANPFSSALSVQGHQEELEDEAAAVILTAIKTASGTFVLQVFVDETTESLLARLASLGPQKRKNSAEVLAITFAIMSHCL